MNVTFDDAPPPGHINFGIGQPSPDLLPVELVRTASADFLANANPLELNYGEAQGDRRFRQSLAGLLANESGVPVNADSLMLTSGNSQALDLVCSQFTRPGDTVFVEEPCYFLAFSILRDRGLKLVGIPTDENGLDIDQLEQALKTVKPAMVYTIPSFHNPGGHCQSAARRQRLAELSEQHGFVIAADEVYQFLHYGGKPPVAFGTLAEEQGTSGRTGTILSLGSFSKILAPGMRLGWIQTTPSLVKRLVANGVVNSGGSLNHFSSHVVRHAIDLGLQGTHLHTLRSTYGKRVEAMDAALKQYLDDRVSWTRPSGGYFFWLECKSDIDTTELRRRAAQFKTGFQAGPVFSVSGQFKNCLRLSFAHYSQSDIVEGVRRLAELMRSAA